MGDRAENLAAARTQLRGVLDVVAESRLYETAPVGGVAKGDFLNQVIEVHTTLSPEALMAACLKIEENLGRVREAKWDSRIIDIDIICFNDLRMENDVLNLPHPEFHKRRFVLVPFAEIAPMHSIGGRRVEDYLSRCADTELVTPYHG